MLGQDVDVDACTTAAAFSSNHLLAAVPLLQQRLERVHTPDVATYCPSVVRLKT